jgi:hypothetical protein
MLLPEKCIDCPLCFSRRRDLEIERPILGQNDNRLKTLK